MSIMTMVPPWVMQYPTHPATYGSPGSSLGSCDGGGLCAVPLSAGAPDGRIGNVTSVWEDVVLQSSDGENGGYQGPKKV